LVIKFLNRKKMKISKIYILLAICLLNIISLHGQDDPNAPAVDKEKLKVDEEDDYYPIVTLPVPENVLLEVGGMTTLPDGRLVLATRRGDVWLVENPSSYLNGTSRYKLYASGLHEPLGCVYKENAIYIAQRGELTKLVDTDGDDEADVYETVYAWPLSGHYHEYSYGPTIAEDGSFFVTGNVAFGDEEWWRGESKVPMRGWTMKISPDGKMEPWATGMRSPCGLGMIDGELFYDDNQGDWHGSGGIIHVKKGSFVGHPAGLRWTSLANSPIKLSEEELYKVANKRQVKNEYGRYIKPENNEADPVQTLYELKDKFKEVQTPAVWLPHGVLGISNAEIKVDNTGGKFGPFSGQLFVGDQGQSKIMRVYLEKVNGEYQGAAFDFRNNFQSGVLRMDWAKDGSLYVGETNRGWGSAGEKNEGLQRVIWTGNIPFEMKEVKAKPDGFEITFTKPADQKTLNNLANYKAESFIYKYFPVYGSPPTKNKELVIKGVKPSADGMSVRIVTDLTKYHIHQLDLEGIKDTKGKGLLHSTTYYTMNNIPEGDKLASSELVKTIILSPTPSSTVVKNTSKKTTTASKTAKAGTTTAKKASTSGTTASATKAATYEEVAPLLKKYTCIACHNQNKRQIGPSYADIAKRNYSNERMLKLIYKPEPSNWPNYSTEMAPMPQVKREDGLKIASWINSLN
jgi:cytochrome c551/c552/glucose/arabinose dehydrogenase